MAKKRSAENDPEHLYYHPFAENSQLKELTEAYRKATDDDES